MHTCLNVDEIIRLIACELIGSKAKASAVALACTRKNFEDPVLDVLWETQNRLLPLLESLPRDACNGRRSTSFKRLPTAPEWTRFRRYARRMRKFEEHGDLNVLTPEVFSVLQLCAANEPLLPNLNALALQSITTEFIPFIPLFLSPRTTTIAITSFPSDPTKAMVASMITTFLTLCPDLQDITIVPLPRDPTIAAAVSEMLLASNPNTLRHFWVDSPLTKEACEVISELPSLRKLLMVIEKDATLPPAVLPNLAQLSIKYDRDDDWLPMFQGAALEKLEAVMFIPGSERIGGFLEAFERAGLAASIENTLSTFYLFTSCSWNPNYSSLLSFGQLTNIIIEFACHNGCSSRVDDDIITNLAQTMPKLQALFLGDPPCHEIPFGVTVEGLVALADHCPDLLALRVHFRVATLSALSVTTPNARSTTARRDCALKELEVGEIPMSEESVLMVALTLALIFPHVHYIDCTDENWEKVVDAIRLSRQIVGYPEATFEDDEDGT